MTAIAITRASDGALVGRLVGSAGRTRDATRRPQAGVERHARDARKAHGEGRRERAAPFSGSNSLQFARSIAMAS